jgi:hypothetical protein
MTHAGPEGTTSGNNSWWGQRDDQGPPHPSACLPRVWLGGHTVGGPCTILFYICGGGWGRFHLSDTRRYSVWGFHMSRMRQYIQVLVHLDPTNAGLHRHRRGLPPWSSEYQIRPTPFLPIQYSPFSLIAPPGLQLCHLFDHLAKPHRTSIDRMCPIVSGFQPLDF